MEGEWTEYEYIDEEDLAQPDFYVDQFYPSGGLQVSAHIQCLPMDLMILKALLIHPIQSIQNTCCT